MLGWHLLRLSCSCRMTKATVQSHGRRGCGHCTQCDNVSLVHKIKQCIPWVNVVSLYDCFSLCKRVWSLHTVSACVRGCGHCTQFQLV